LARLLTLLRSNQSPIIQALAQDNWVVLLNRSGFDQIHSKAAIFRMLYLISLRTRSFEAEHGRAFAAGPFANWCSREGGLQWFVGTEIELSRELLTGSK